MSVISSKGRLWVIEPAALTVDTAIYAAGDLIGKHTGGKLVFTLPWAPDTGANGAGGLIRGAMLIDEAKQGDDIDLLLFGTSPANTTFTDNGALDVDDTDLKQAIAAISFTTDYALSDNQLTYLGGLQIPFVVDTANILYGALVSRGTPTYVAATDLKLRLIIEPM